MRKFLLLAGIFTIFAYSQAKAEQYYENDGYYYQDEPRYVERVEYREPVRQGYRKAGYEYQETDSSSRYKRIRNSDRVSYQRENYRQSNYYNQYEEPNKIRPYIGLDVATSSIDFSEKEYEDVLEDGHNSLTLVVGAKFNKNFGVEAFVQQSSEEEKQDNYEDFSVKTTYSALGLDLIGYMPINQDVELLASLGLAQYNFNETDTYDNGYYEEWDKSNMHTMGLRLGIGAQVKLTNNIALRGMARYIKMNDDDIIKSMTEFSLGLRYMF